MDFANKTIWITGASSGIGRALAIAFAAAGARTILSGRNAAALAEVAAACPGAATIAFDTTDLESLPTHVAAAQSVTGAIDILINNAGIAQRSFAQDTPLEIYRTIMEVDFFAPVRLTQLVLPAMLARGQGHIAIVSSVSGKFGNPGGSAYCAAKFACIGYFQSLASEVAHQGIGVSVITPGFVKTEVAVRALDAAGKPFGPPAAPIDRGITAEEAAEQILAAMRAGTREIPVGRGPEMALLDVLRSNPDQVFDLMAAMGKAAAETR